MDNKVLGKIVSAEFGRSQDRPFLFGLQLHFKMGQSSGVGDGGKYLTNISPECEWANSDERAYTFTSRLEDLNKVLEDANVFHVSQLIGKPVEITLDRNVFRSFRILTEVI